MRFISENYFSLVYVKFITRNYLIDFIPSKRIVQGSKNNEKTL